MHRGSVSMKKERQLAGILLALAALLILTGPAVTEVLPEDGSLTEQHATREAANAHVGRENLATTDAQSGAEVREPKQGQALQMEVVEAARAHSLPADFFQRLIWQES